MPEIGQKVLHYKILEKLGGGGMGVVYKAENIKLGSHVALKFLSEELSKDRESVERLKREARLASSLHHPNICSIFDIDEYEGRYFIVMELLEGMGLKNRIGEKPLPLNEVLDMGYQIADGLAAAHLKGFIHRDIKPANIFITHRGHVKILDFGLAKPAEIYAKNGQSNWPTLSPAEMSPPDTIPAAVTHKAPEQTPKGDLDVKANSFSLSPGDLTRPGMTLGTLAYMSPEQALGKELDVKSDIFSLGVTLYEMATGKLPFRGNTAAAMYDDILHGNPLPPSKINPTLPQQLDGIIARLMEKDSNRRKISSSQLAAELSQLKFDVTSGKLAVHSKSPNGSTRRYLYLFALLIVAALVIGYKVSPFFQKGTSAINPNQQEANKRLISGASIYNSLDKGNPEKARQAISEFEKAFDLNPKLASAPLKISMTYWKYGTFTESIDAFKQAKDWADRTTEVSDSFGEGHHWRARLLAFYDHNWAAAEDEYSVARKGNPKLMPDPDYLLWQGKRAEALDSIENALKQGDSTSAAEHVEAGWNYFFAGKPDKAEEQAYEARNLDKKSAYCWLLGNCYARKGEKYQIAAFRYFLEAMESENLLGANSRDYYVKIFMQSKMNGFWRSFAEKNADKISRYDLAAIYARLNEVDKAFETLDAMGSLPVEKPLVADPRFDSIRKDPRYARLLKSHFGL
jgi:serine/threonine protein kinase